MFERFRQPLIQVSMLPETIATSAGGILRLKVFRLESGGKVLVEGGSYNSETANAGLGPPTRGKVDPAKWAAIYDAHVTHLTHHWREVLASQPAKFERLFKRWGNPDLKIADLIHRIDPPGLAISLDGTISMGFGLFPEFPNHNLEVELSFRYRVRDVSFNG